VRTYVRECVWNHKKKNRNVPIEAEQRRNTSKKRVQVSATQCSEAKNELALL
jgi:hypothetical protein